MTDWRDVATRPDPNFEARLEHLLVRELFGDERVDQSAGRTFPGSNVGPSTALHQEVLVELEQHSANPNRPRWWLAGAAVLLLVTGAIGILVSKGDSSSSPASTDPQTTVPVRTVTFDVQWPALDGLESTECIPTSVIYESAQDGHCWRTFAGEATLSGGIAGTALWAMNANLGIAGDANDSTVEVPAIFNGTYLVQAEIPDCGAGVFMIAESLRFVGWDSGQFLGTWQIMPDSGRGEFASIAGSGTITPATTNDVDTTREHTGTITCD